MDYATLGRTGIIVNKNGFGALPIQRISEDDAVALLKKAYDNGITFFDTARMYTDSEKKVGLALSCVRDKIILATKAATQNSTEFWQQLETSLTLLKTDYVDIYQFHNPPFCPLPGDESGLYDAMLEARSQGKIRHIGITNHRIGVARDALRSGLYDTIQYPFSYLASDDEVEFVRECAEQDVGILAMKALSGGLITNSAAAYAFLAQFPGVIPIWGVQREGELAEFVAYQSSPPVLDDGLKRVIDRDIAELSGDFCRGCGYCMPCPAGIEISNAARMSLMLRRAPLATWLGNQWKESMNRINDCTNCGHCKAHCPYGLDAPKLLRDNWIDFQNYI